MEVSSGEEYYIASDNTGTPLAVFSSNGQMIKQVTHKVTLNLTLFAINYCSKNCVVKTTNLHKASGICPKRFAYKTLNPYQLQGRSCVPETVF